MKTHLAMQTSRAAYTDPKATTPSGFTFEIANHNRYPLTSNGLACAVAGCVNVTKTWVEASSLSIVVVTEADMYAGQPLMTADALFRLMTLAAAGKYDELYKACGDILEHEFAFQDFA